MLTEIHTSELTDVDNARFAFLRASNMLWALGDPPRAKEIIDEASRGNGKRWTRTRPIRSSATARFVADVNTASFSVPERLVTLTSPGFW